MVEYVRSWIENLMRVARDDYGVNPIIFLAIYLICVPIFYYSLVRTLRGIAKKLKKEIMIGSAIFLAVNVAPFVYVIIFGHNIPWWVYGVIAILVGQGIYSLIAKIRKGPSPKVQQ
jgi:hypothetical protein